MTTNSHNQHSGVALILVLLTLAIASVAAVSLSSARQLDIRRTESLLRSTQAWEYLYSIESWAANYLATVNSERSILPNLPKTEVVGGSIRAELTDLQGRLNLNALLSENQINEVELQRFQRLLVALKIQPDFIDALLDWLDSDETPRYPNGAEDESYLQRQPPYRSANRLLADISELRLIAGINQEDLVKLEPYVYVTQPQTTINVNAAPELILRSLAEKIDSRKTESLIRYRQHQAFKSIESFLEHDSIVGMGINKQGLGVSSQYYLLSSVIQVGKISWRFDSQLKRSEDGTVTLIKRNRRNTEYG